LKADLNIFAGAQYDWTQPRDYSRFNTDNLQWEAGLELNLPFDRLRQRNSYRGALIAFEERLRTLTLALDNLKDSIDRGVRTLEQRRQNYLIQKNALALANAHAAVLMPQSELTAEKLAETIVQLFSDREQLKGMSDAAKRLSHADAAGQIAEIAVRLAKD